MATGVLLPMPKLVVIDALGLPVPGALATFYAAGTTTAVPVYADVGLTTTLSVPVAADVGGRFVPIYLVPGTSYKLLVTDASGSALTGYPVDNITGQQVSTNADLVGTAGETITAGQGVYLSDGSGSLVSGRWYKWDSSQIYSSVLPEIGIAITAMTAGNTGTIRLVGLVTGLSGLASGTTYYAGAAGALTTTAPTLARFVGVADTTTSIVLSAERSVGMWANDFRLTLTSGTPITISDVTAAGTIYCSPLTGNRIDLPDANGNPVRYTSAEFSIAVPALTSQMYDIFCYGNAGVATLELLAWTNDTTRATAIVRTNGRYMKSGDSTRLYLASVRTTTAANQTEDSFTKRYLWNHYNRTPRELFKAIATANWTYMIATLRQMNADTANQVEIVVGVAEVMLSLYLSVGFATDQAAGGISVTNAIGEDSTTVASTSEVGGTANNLGAANSIQINSVTFAKYPAIGRHFYAGLEKSTAVGTTTWYSASSGGAGLIGQYLG